MDSSAFKIRSICCIGAGYVGGPTMAVIADHCPSINVEVVDLNENRIKAWNDSDLKRLPIYEPGLDAVIKRTRGKNLHFSTSIETAIANADMIFISVNTPTKTKGLGSGEASDLKWVEACARQVAKYAKGETIVVEKSTLPVRTAQTIQTILKASQENSNEGPFKNSFIVLSNPEFLSEGTAIQDLENPERVLIGGEDQNAIEALSSIYQNWVPAEKILRTNIWSSELSKLIANAFLAQRISSINSVAALCEVTGADVREVARAIGSDSRIGTKFINSGPGFGGSCFKKDILNLVYLSRHFGLPEVADYWQKVVSLNNWQQDRISHLIVQKLFGTVSGKKIALFGFAFKANTNDTRESPAIQIAKDLIEEGAILKIYDPQVSSQQISFDLNLNESKNLQQSSKQKIAKLENEGSWSFSEKIEQAVNETDAVIVLTEWSEFKEIQWSKLAPRMRKPAWVFDTRAIVNSYSVQSAGLKLWRIGDGTI